jgi:hypothetical protein
MNYVLDVDCSEDEDLNTLYRNQIPPKYSELKKMIQNIPSNV